MKLVGSNKLRKTSLLVGWLGLGLANFNLSAALEIQPSQTDQEILDKIKKEYDLVTKDMKKAYLAEGMLLNFTLPETNDNEKIRIFNLFNRMNLVVKSDSEAQIVPTDPFGNPLFGMTSNLSIEQRLKLANDSVAQLNPAKATLFTTRREEEAPLVKKLGYIEMLPDAALHNRNLPKGSRLWLDPRRQGTIPQPMIFSHEGILKAKIFSGHVVAILEEAGKRYVVMVKDKTKGRLTIPGGTQIKKDVEGEINNKNCLASLEKTASREFSEEVGVDLKNDLLAQTLQHFNFFGGISLFGSKTKDKVHGEPIDDEGKYFRLQMSAETIQHLRSIFNLDEVKANPHLVTKVDNNEEISHLALIDLDEVGGYDAKIDLEEGKSVEIDPLSLRAAFRAIGITDKEPTAFPPHVKEEIPLDVEAFSML